MARTNSKKSGGGKLRKTLIEADLMACMVALPKLAVIEASTL